MFELKVFSCETITLKDGKVFYRLWFTLPDGSFAWLTSNQIYAAGDSVKIKVCPAFTQDTKTNLRLTVKIVSK